MEKIWLQQYSSNVPAEIELIPYQSLVALFEQCCRQFADKPAYMNFGCTLHYAKLEKLSRYFSAYLMQVLGHQKGDRIALMLPNILQYPVVLFGALRAGLTVVCMNPFYKSRELIQQLNDSGAITVVVLANVAHELERILEKTQVRNVLITQVGDLLSFPKSWAINWVLKYIKKQVPPWHIPAAHSFKNILRQGQLLPFAPPAVHLEDIAFLQYTAGTTGAAKGAALTHRNILANLTQVSLWFQQILEPGKEIILTALPLFHIFSLTANCLVFLYFGGCNVLITNPRDIPRLVKSIRGIPLTAITGVNTLLNALLNYPPFTKLNFNALKMTLGGGMAVQPEVAQRWQAVTGKPLLAAYGLTEASPGVTICPVTQAEFNGSVGLPLPSTEITLRDEEEQEVRVGEVGELWIRGPQVMQGYWRRPEETSQVLSSEGWLKTGDLAVIDSNGFLSIVDRKKDIILVSGFNVSPQEVESCVSEHPGVAEVAAVGVADPHSGEVVKLFVVKKDPHLTAEQLLSYCRQQLSAYKVPKSIEFRTELPKNQLGKVLRCALQNER